LPSPTDAAAPLPVLVSQAWFLHCSAPTIRDKFFTRLEKKVSSSTFGSIPGLGGWMKEAAEETARKRFSFDAEELEPVLRARGELK
jgi:hypothetical protein